MTSLVLCKSIEFCQLFCAIDDFVAIRRRFREIVSRRHDRTIDLASFIKLFAIGPEVAEHVFNLFDYYHRDAINYNNFLLALCLFTNARSSKKIDLVRDMFYGGFDRKVYRPELIHIVDLLIDSACNMMGVNVHDAGYIMMADLKAREIADTIMDDGGKPGFIPAGDLYGLVDKHDTFADLRTFVLEIAIRSGDLLCHCSDPYLPPVIPNQRFHIMPMVSSTDVADCETCPVAGTFLCLHRYTFPEYCMNAHNLDSYVCLDRALTPQYCISGPETSSCIHTLNFYRQSDFDCDDPDRNLLIGEHESNVCSTATMHGYVFKQTWFLRRLKRRWIVIRNNMMYSFHTEESVKPNLVLPLSGATCNPFVTGEEVSDPILPNNARPRFAFRLVSALSNISRIIFVYTAEQRDTWVKAIRVASRNFILAEHYHMSHVVHPCLPNVFECKGAHTGKRYMMKYIDKLMVKETDLAALRTEAGVLRFAEHPCIASTVAIYEDRYKIYVIRRHIPRWVHLDELIRACGVLSLNSVALIMRQVFSGLKYLHSHGMALGVLGPCNILLHLDKLRQHRIQMVDIGLRKFHISALDRETLSYVAPEVEQGSRYNTKADMWSAGAMIYRLLTPESCHLDTTAAKRGELNLSRTRAPANVTSTVKRLMSRNSSKRYCPDAALQLQWIKSAVEKPFELHFPSQFYMPQLLPQCPYAAAGGCTIDLATGECHTHSVAGESVTVVKEKFKTQTIGQETSEIIPTKG